MASEEFSNAKAVIRFEQRVSESPFIERVWRCRSERGGRFFSIAACNFEMAITRLAGGIFLTLRGPETKATVVECPANGEWLGIRFRPGAFMPEIAPGQLRDQNDLNLPGASGKSFWLRGSAWQYPDYENAEVFVNRLAKAGIVVRDGIVEDAVRGRLATPVSMRTEQRHFQRATGLRYSTFRQIQRARYAALLLLEGVPAADAADEAGYFDQPHMTHSFARFIGLSPARVAAREDQLSFLYKTELPD